MERYCEDLTIATATSSKVVEAGPPSSLGSGPPRKDTDILIAELFEEEAGAEGRYRSGSGLSAEASRLLVQTPSAAASGGSSSEAAPPPPPPPPPDNARRNIQREMEDLRDELRDGQSQWEVHEQIGKGGYGVVYKVGG